MLLRWNLPQQLCSSLIPYHPISFPGGKWWGRCLRFFWALEETILNHPTAFPTRSSDMMVFAYSWSSWGWGHEMQDKRGVTIRKTWPRAAGEKLSFTYLSDKGVAANLLLNFRSSVLWWSASKSLIKVWGTGLALFLIFTPVSPLGCKWNLSLQWPVGYKHILFQERTL